MTKSIVITATANETAKFSRIDGKLGKACEDTVRAMWTLAEMVDGKLASTDGMRQHHVPAWIESSGVLAGVASTGAVSKMLTVYRTWMSADDIIAQGWTWDDAYLAAKGTNKRANVSTSKHAKAAKVVASLTDAEWATLVAAETARRNA
jgi:hypothetical protein